MTELEKQVYLWVHESPLLAISGIFSFWLLLWGICYHCILDQNLWLACFLFQLLCKNCYTCGPHYIFLTVFPGYFNAFVKDWWCRRVEITFSEGFRETDFFASTTNKLTVKTHIILSLITVIFLHHAIWNSLDMFKLIIGRSDYFPLS